MSIYKTKKIINEFIFNKQRLKEIKGLHFRVFEQIKSPSARRDFYSEDNR
jgi:hypothetical protein